MWLQLGSSGQVHAHQLLQLLAQGDPVPLKLRHRVQRRFHRNTLATGLEDATRSAMEMAKLDMVKDSAYANRMEILGHEGDPIHYNYYKYISVVPHIFVDTSTSD